MSGSANTRAKPLRPRHKLIIYDVLQVAARMSAIIGFQFRFFGQENYPATGPGLVCSNHQSHYDPVIVGMTCNRRLNYLARKDLFRFGPFRWLIEMLDAIPLDRDGFGIGGLKETLRRLRNDEFVLIFPEGTRTRDGEMLPLKPGLCAVARRSRAPLIPVGFDGAYQAWPRPSKMPGLSRIVVVVGTPIDYDTYNTMSDQEVMELLAKRIHGCFEQARNLRRRSFGLPPVTCQVPPVQM